MADQRITDLSYLEDMGMGDDSLLIEMIQLFLDNTPESLRLMKEHEANNDWEKLSAEAHKLKPNLSYMGLNGAREIILDIEESVKDEAGLDAISGQIRELETICRKAYTELSERLDELQG